MTEETFPKSVSCINPQDDLEMNEVYTALAYSLVTNAYLIKGFGWWGKWRFVPYNEDVTPVVKKGTNDPAEANKKLGAILYPSTASGYPDGNPKTAIGLTKPSMSNVPAPALLPMTKAFADGAKKYGRLNWRENGVTASVYYDAAQRHLMAWWDGEDKADDSGVHHLGHAMACLAIILDAERHAKLNDDRSGFGEFSKMVKELTETKGCQASA